MEICLSLVHKPITGNFLFTLPIKNSEKKKNFNYYYVMASTGMTNSKCLAVQEKPQVNE